METTHSSTPVKGKRPAPLSDTAVDGNMSGGSSSKRSRVDTADHARSDISLVDTASDVKSKAASDVKSKATRVIRTSVKAMLDKFRVKEQPYKKGELYVGQKVTVRSQYVRMLSNGPRTSGLGELLKKPVVIFQGDDARRGPSVPYGTPVAAGDGPIKVRVDMGDMGMFGMTCHIPRNEICVEGTTCSICLADIPINKSLDLIVHEKHDHLRPDLAHGKFAVFDGRTMKECCNAVFCNGCAARYINREMARFNVYRGNSARGFECPACKRSPSAYVSSKGIGMAWIPKWRRVHMTTSRVNEDGWFATFLNECEMGKQVLKYANLVRTCMAFKGYPLQNMNFEKRDEKCFKSELFKCQTMARRKLSGSNPLSGYELDCLDKLAKKNGYDVNVREYVSPQRRTMDAVTLLTTAGEEIVEAQDSDADSDSIDLTEMESSDSEQEYAYELITSYPDSLIPPDISERHIPIGTRMGV